MTILGVDVLEVLATLGGILAALVIALHALSALAWSLNKLAALTPYKGDDAVTEKIATALDKAASFLEGARDKIEPLVPKALGGSKK